MYIIQNQTRYIYIYSILSVVIPLDILYEIEYEIEYEIDRHLVYVVDIDFVMQYRIGEVYVEICRYI